MFSYIDDYKELRQVIAENPALPLVFSTSDECGNPDYAWSLATAKAEKGILLNCKPDEANDEKIYTDEDDLREDIEEYVSDENELYLQEEIKEKVDEIMKKYDDKWIEVIWVKVEPY